MRNYYYTLYKEQFLLLYTDVLRPGKGWVPPGYSCPKHAT